MIYFEGNFSPSLESKLTPSFWWEPTLLKGFKRLMYPLISDHIVSIHL